MTIHDNQPVQFNTPESQSCDTIPYAQIVNENDITQFQMELTPCDDAINLVVNGSFADTLLAEWTNASGKWNSIDNAACYSFVGLSGDLEQSILTINTYYKVEFEVTSQVGDGRVEVLLGTHSVGFATGTGVHTFYGFCDDTNTEFTLRGSANTVDSSICLDDISVFEVDLNLLVALVDKDDNQILTRYLPDFITVVEAGVFDFNQIDGDEFNLTDNYLTMFFDWTTEAIAHGCYNFVIADNCINTNGQMRIPNGEMGWPSFQTFGIPFPTDQPWVLTDLVGGVTTVQSGVLKMIGNVPLDGGTAVQTLLQLGNTYNYELEITNIGPSQLVQIAYGTATDVYSTIGVHSGSLVADGVDLTITITGAGTCNINYIRHNVPDSELFFDHEGVNMQFGDYDNTLLINACNDSNSFNFGFEGTGFSPTVRVESKLVNAQFPMQRRVERNSNGRSRVVFYDRNKHRTLKIGYHPEYIHDFLSLVTGFDHFYIDLVEWFVAPEEEYFIEYGDQDTIGKVSFDVILKEQIIRNAACKAEGVGCALPPNFLEQETGDLVLGENGEFILITG